jgi:hypothetical protein
MHRKKEEVILRILAQESLDLELWLQRYEFLELFFEDFSEARDIFVNIFQISGPYVIPHSEIAGTKPPYVCPGCFIHTYSNNMINGFHVQ